MLNPPTRLVSVLEKYFDPKVPREKQGLLMRKRPNTLVFMMASADRDDPVDVHLIRVDGGFEVGVAHGSAYHHGPIFTDTDESAQKMLDWIRSR